MGFVLSPFPRVSTGYRLGNSLDFSLVSGDAGSRRIELALEAIDIACFYDSLILLQRFDERGRWILGSCPFPSRASRVAPWSRILYS